MARKRPCSRCGEVRWASRGSRQQIICRLCRSSERRSAKCAHCHANFEPKSKGARGWTRFCCRACADAARRNPSTPAHHRTRRERVGRTAGLTEAGMKKLRAKWERQGRTCVFCGGTPETVEHLIPLSRGGSNYEGNLAPACRRCNSRKTHRLVSEFRYGKEAGASKCEAPARSGRGIRVREYEQREFALCSICGAMYATPGQTCSISCAAERNRRVNRDLYRQRNGLPVDATRPSGRWAA